MVSLGVISLEQSAIVGLLTFLLGLILGHRLSLGRDKRKEFNEIATPIRANLLKQIEVLRSGKFTQSLVTNQDFISLGMLIGKWREGKFKADRASYDAAQNNCGHFEHGEYVIDDLSSYLSATEKLLTYVRLR